MRELRRQDRELNEKRDIIEIINSNTVLRMAFCDGDFPYIIPMNYGFNEDNMTFYFHSAKEGAKFDIMQKNNNVSLVIDCEHKLVEGKVPCQYTFEFSSVVANGKAYVIEDEDEKILAMKTLMKHVSGKDFDFNSRLLSVIKIWKVEIEEYKGKKRRVQAI